MAFSAPSFGSAMDAQNKRLQIVRQVIRSNTLGLLAYDKHHNLAYFFKGRIRFPGNPHMLRTRLRLCARQDERARIEHVRQRAWIILRVGRNLSKSDVAGCPDEFLELPVRDGCTVHPEIVHRDPVERASSG